ncbi:uncharacterized [Tachysurus ichikawai]
MSGSLKPAAGGCKQSLCRSLIVPLWSSAQAVQGHVGPGAPSHHNLRCGQILHTTPASFSNHKHTPILIPADLHPPPPAYA